MPVAACYGPSSMDERHLREQSFHDRVYQHDTRAVTAKFYKVNTRSRELYRDILERECRPGSRVLEYGCGQGSSAFDLAERGAVVSAIDISAAGLNEAWETARKRNVPDIDFRLMDAEALAFDESTFDVVCGTAILHHLDLERAFSEVARVLRPGGRAVFIEPLGHNPLINLYRKRTPELRTPDEHPLVMTDFDTARRHFEIVEVSFLNLLSLAAVPFRNAGSFPRILRFLDRADEVLFDLVPPARKLAWYAVMEFRDPKKPR